MLSVYSYPKKQSLEKISDFLFQPARYLFGGKMVFLIPTGKKEGDNLEVTNQWRQHNIEYDKSLLKTVLSIICLVPFSIIGAAFYAASLICSSKYEMQREYTEAIKNNKVIDQTSKHKKVVIVHDGLVPENSLLTLFKGRYSSDTDFKLIWGSKGKEVDTTNIPKTEDYDLFFVLSACLYFFDSEGIFNDTAYDLFKSKATKTLVKLENHNTEWIKDYIDLNPRHFKDHSFNIEAIPRTYL